MRDVVFKETKAWNWDGIAEDKLQSSGEIFHVFYPETIGQDGVQNHHGNNDDAPTLPSQNGAATGNSTPGNGDAAESKDPSDQKEDGE